jgi:hypothetical protein
MAESRKFYLWQVSRCSNITSKFDIQFFNDRRPAEKLFRTWRKDPDTKDMVYLAKVWSAWNRKDVCSMMNGRTKCEIIKEKPVFQYAKKAWEEHERLREFKENWAGGQDD